MTTGYGIIGAGYFGAELGRIAAALPGGRVGAIYSPEHAEALGEELGAPVVATLRELVEHPDVDVVVIASPNHVHREPVELAAAAGKHVFCEKPIALSFEDAEAMVSVCEDAGVMFMAGHVMHFMDGVRRARDLMADGAIGRVLLARGARTGWVDDDGSVPGWKRRRDMSGGHLFHHIHELDVIQLVVGRAERVTMIGGNLAHRVEDLGPGAHADEDDLIIASLEFPGDAVGIMQWGSAFRIPEHYVEFLGTTGSIRIDFQDVGVEVRTADGVERIPLHRSAEEDAERIAEYAASRSGGGVDYGNPHMRPPGWLQGIMVRELEYLHGLLRGERDVDPVLAGLTDGSAARDSIATAHALTLSLAEDRKVTVSELAART